MLTDPIADMLTRMRNALAVGKKEVLIPYSRMNFSIVQLLERDGWVAHVERVAASPTHQKKQQSRFEMIRVRFRYGRNGEATLHRLRRISKPGRRVYVTKENLPEVLNNFGAAILSTSQGMLTNHDAKKKGVGGEVICEIY